MMVVPRWIRLYKLNARDEKTLVLEVIEANGVIVKSPPGKGEQFEGKCAGSVFDYAAKRKLKVEIENDEDPF